MPNISAVSTSEELVAIARRMVATYDPTLTVYRAFTACCQPSSSLFLPQNIYVGHVFINAFFPSGSERGINFYIGPNVSQTFRWYHIENTRINITQYAGIVAFSQIVDESANDNITVNFTGVQVSLT